MSIKGKLAVVLCGVIAIFVLGLTLRTLQTKLTEARTLNTQQQCVIDQTSVSQKETAASAAVTERSVADTVHVITKLVIDQKAIDDEVNSRVADIEREYASKPPTPENTALRSDAVSRARLNGLWDTYCSGGNTDKAGCTGRRTAN